MVRTRLVKLNHEQSFLHLPACRLSWVSKSTDMMMAWLKPNDFFKLGGVLAFSRFLRNMIQPFDIQINGYAGVDFCASDLNEVQIHEACRKLRDDGVEQILATLITDDIAAMEAKIANLVRLRNSDKFVSGVIAGIHVEGPFLSGRAGFIGAHPVEFAVPASLETTKRLVAAGQGLLRLFTLAPEMDSGGETTKFLVREGVVVSAGHCDPTMDQLATCLDHGLSMVTHFGNGCPVDLPRHDNILQRLLSFRDRLWFSFIPDGSHIPVFALKNYLELVGSDRSIAVSDAISAATMGPGTHLISGMEVQVDDLGVARKPGSKNLAGSTTTMSKIQAFLQSQVGLDASAIKKMIDTNPRKALRMTDRER